MNNPLGVSPRKGNRGTTRGKETNPLTSVGIEPPTFSVRPRSSVGRVTVDLIRRSWVRFLPRVVPRFSFLGLTPSGLFMGSISTLIYASELILCFTICVLSATRHNIQEKYEIATSAGKHIAGGKHGKTCTQCHAKRGKTYTRYQARNGENNRPLALRGHVTNASLKQ